MPKPGTWLDSVVGRHFFIVGQAAFLVDQSDQSHRVLLVPAGGHSRCVGQGQEPSGLLKIYQTLRSCVVYILQLHVYFAQDCQLT